MAWSTDWTAIGDRIVVCLSLPSTDRMDPRGSRKVSGLDIVGSTNSETFSLFGDAI